MYITNAIKKRKNIYFEVKNYYNYYKTYLLPNKRGTENTF